MASLKGDDLVVFYYLSASEIWLNKRGGLSQGRQFSSILLSEIWPNKKGDLSQRRQFSSILLI